MTTLRSLLTATAITAALAAAPAFATDVDANGQGFISKGDVHDALGWNNHDLQAEAYNLLFTIESTSITTWTCTGPGNSVTPRHNTSTASGVIAYAPRTNPQNKVTGFFALGFVDGSAASSTDGHALYSCPGDGGKKQNHTYNGDAATTSNGGGLTVCDLDDNDAIVACGEIVNSSED